MIKIRRLSMISSLGYGAEFNAAAMRCGYEGFKTESLGQKGELYTSRIYLNAEKEEINNRTMALLLLVIEDVLSDITASDIALYLCLEDMYYMYDKSDEFREFFKLLKKKHKHNYFDIQKIKQFTYGRSSIIHAFKNVQEVFSNEQYKYVLIVNVGSTLMPKDISYYNTQNRLLTDDNSNGFIPGEAATAILLSKPTGEENEIIISGVGTAKEMATIFNEEELLRGKGLSEAIMEASNQAKLRKPKINPTKQSIS